MRVMHLIDSGGLYGAETVILNLTSCQGAHGLDPVIGSIGLPGDRCKAIESEAERRGVRVARFRMPAGFSLRGLTQIRRFIAVEGVRLVHSHGYKPNILLGSLPVRARPFPIVATVHGWTSTAHWSRLKVYGWLNRRALTRFDSIVVVSRNMLTHAGVRALPPGCVHVVWNGISASSPKVLPNAARVSAPSGRHVILAVGRLSAEKGFDVLLDALALLLKTRNDIHVYLAGDGPMRARLEQQASRLGVAHHVTFSGYVISPVETLPATLLVIPSLTEGLPVVLLEAMRSRVPVVATRVGGIPEIVESESLARLVGPGDAEALAEEIGTCLLHPEVTTGMAARAQDFFERRLTAESMASSYREVYESVLQSRPSA